MRPPPYVWESLRCPRAAAEGSADTSAGLWPSQRATRELAREAGTEPVASVDGGIANRMQAETGMAEALQQWEAEGAAWKAKRETRLQHVLSHMNHHVHPLVNAETGERKPLASCQPKSRPNECKSGFPLENEVTDRAVLVCPCIAQELGLEGSGPRSRIG